MSLPLDEVPVLKDLRPGMQAELDRIRPIMHERLANYIQGYDTFANLLEVLVLHESLCNRIAAETTLFGPRKRTIPVEENKS